MTTLQMIIKKAQALRKAAPKKYAKWTDYVKAASATIKPKKKATVSGVKKKAVKKAAPKKAVKKLTPKKATSIHKDSKSHNVRINVVSGLNIIKLDAIQTITGNNKFIIYLENLIDVYTKKLNNKEYQGTDIKKYKKLIVEHKKYIIALKKQNTNLKKYI